jgi:hypothetical protein
MPATRTFRTMTERLVLNRYRCRKDGSEMLEAQRGGIPGLLCPECRTWLNLRFPKTLEDHAERIL